MLSKLLYSISLVSVTCLANISHASPWIKPDDLNARLRIELLASGGIISSPITQWPLMWGSILPDLRQAQYRKLSEAQKLAVDSLMSQFQRDSAPAQVAVQAGWADQEATVFGGFGSGSDAPQFGSISAGFVSQAWAGEINVTYDVPERLQEHTNVDGSYLATAIGNWALAAGSFGRWWGPGWQSSLILSDNARPVPGLSIQRNKSTPFESAPLSWLGPWQLQAFIGKLESDRTIPDAKLVGLRMSFKPFQWLEVGASRTAQWGGDGRPESVSSFKDLVFGKDNRGDSGITSSNEPGNQLGGFDAKVSFNTPWGSQGAYWQYIGEDESGIAPSRYIYMAGLDGIILLKNSSLHWFMENADTTAGKLHGGINRNYAYEHGTYRSGYRYKGRALGASIDGDSRISTAGFNWMINDHGVVKVSWSEVSLNPDNQKPTGFSGEGKLFQTSYLSPIGSGSAEIGYRHIDDDVKVRALKSEGVDTVFVKVNWAW